MLAVYITPFFTENAIIFMEHLSRIEGARLAVVSQEPQEILPEKLRGRFAGHWRVPDCLQTDQLQWAVEGLQKSLGKVGRILAANEHIQVQVAEVRERLGIPGMDSATALKFRDKNKMKKAFREGGVAWPRSICSQAGQR